MHIAKNIFLQICDMPVSNVQHFINTGINVNFIRSLKNQIPVLLDPYSFLLYALITDDIKTVPRDHLKKAILSVKNDRVFNESMTMRQIENVNAMLQGLNFVAEILNPARKDREYWLQYKFYLSPLSCFLNLAGSQCAQLDLSRLNLAHANFFNADLTEANLTKSIMEGANLKGAILSKAILTSTILYNVLFPDNLEEVYLEQACFLNVSSFEVDSTDDIELFFEKNKNHRCIDALKISVANALAALAIDLPFQYMDYMSANRPYNPRPARLMLEKLGKLPCFNFSEAQAGPYSMNLFNPGLSLKRFQTAKRCQEIFSAALEEVNSSPYMDSWYRHIRRTIF